MGFRTRSATPGTVLCLAATVLLAVTSFNTPLLKSLYFLEARFSAGEYSGTLHLGTLGYCLNDVCQGPQVGYEFNPNSLFDISVFDIPTAITKYLTYALILHIVALAAAGLATIFGALSHISTLSVWCFPTCFASIASSISLIALVFDLVIFYIAKARIDDVQGASASIGISVWLVLAAWLCAGLGGCAFGIGRCCVNRRGNRESGDPSKNNYYAGQNQTDDMRLQALRDEQIRKKEQGLPSFQELERTPLTTDHDEDKYLYEDRPNVRRDGSLVQGVGVGYGRRNGGGSGYGGSQAGYGGSQVGYNTLQAPPGVARRDSVISSTMGPGAAGVGAGGQGVESANQNYDQYYGGNGQNGYYDQEGQGYNDPYAQQSGPYAHDQYGYAQQPQQHSYPPVAGAMVMPTPGYGRRSADPYAHNNQNADPYASANASSESHYTSPGPHVTHADPYDAYDDGLGAIGRAATNAPQNTHQRDYTGSYDQNTAGNGYSHNPYDNPAPASYGGGGGGAASRQPAIQVPTPQHLTTHNSASDLLRSPISPPPHDPYGAAGPGYASNQLQQQPLQLHGQHRMDDDEEDDYNRPPSYGSVAGVGNSSGNHNGYPQEKSQYR